MTDLKCGPQLVEVTTLPTASLTVFLHKACDINRQQSGQVTQVVLSHAILVKDAVIKPTGRRVNSQAVLTFASKALVIGATMGSIPCISTSTTHQMVEPLIATPEIRSSNLFCPINRRSSFSIENIFRNDPFWESAFPPKV